MANEDLSELEHLILRSEQRVGRAIKNLFRLVQVGFLILFLVMLFPQNASVFLVSGIIFIFTSHLIFDLALYARKQFHDAKTLQTQDKENE